jgi:hypothetical protein
MNEIAPNSISGFLIALFVVLSIVDWWMNMVQHTTMNICRANDQPKEICVMLNPFFIRWAFPITLLRWVIAGAYAWLISWQFALVGLFIAWLIGVLSPIPLYLTLPSIFKKISIVKSMDHEAGSLLESMVSKWNAVGRKHY